MAVGTKGKKKEEQMFSQKKVINSFSSSGQELQLGVPRDRIRLQRRGKQ